MKLNTFFAGMPVKKYFQSQTTIIVSARQDNVFKMPKNKGCGANLTLCQFHQ